MKVVIGNDHAGTSYKVTILKYLKTRGLEVKNYGTDDEVSVDYPDFAHPVSSDINTGKADRGILICGSGNGVAITANKYKNVRAGICWNIEVVKLIRKHNDANILVLPARFVSLDTATDMVKIFLETPFEGGRHKKRVEKITHCI